MDKSMKDKVILITGSSGEIGLNLISYLSKNTNKKIIALDLKKHKKNSKIFKFIKGSILDKKLLSDISKKYIIEDIYHLAAILSTKAETNPLLARDVNVKGTLNIFQIGLYQNFDIYQYQLYVLNYYIFYLHIFYIYYHQLQYFYYDVLYNLLIVF